MGRHTLIELVWMIGALLLALLFTWGAAWAYPLGKDAIWATGGVAMIVVVLMNVATIRDARKRDNGGD